MMKCVGILPTAMVIFFCMARLLADETPVFSGPQFGEMLTPFTVIGVYGEYCHRTLDLVEMSGGKPTMLLFVHNDDSSGR